MNLFLHRSPFWLKTIFPSYEWRVKTQDPVIYLTFDDGPVPDITAFVLDTLAQYEAKGTFFCIGDNVRKHPEVYAKIRAEGHAIGNHTFNHMNGWKTETEVYLENYYRCQDILELPTNLFRPPYGRIRREQYLRLPESTRVIMWDVLSGDFSQAITPEICLFKSIRYTRPGSILLFHDSIKANRNMAYTLPRYMDHFAAKGYRFEAMPMC